MPESKSGFIVCNERGALVVTAYPPYAPVAGVLVLSHRRATHFPSQAEARAAINRTRRYVKREGLQWATDYQIINLVPPSEELRPTKRKESAHAR